MSDNAEYTRPTTNGVEKVKNHITVIGDTGLDAPLNQGDSASRLHMANVHKQQRVDILEPELPYMLAGGEREIGKYTCDVFMPFTGYVEEKIPHYTSMHQRDVPFTLIIRDQQTGEHCFLEVHNYVQEHVKFAHKTQFEPFVRNLSEGDIIEKGQRLTRTTNIHEGELHANTVNAMVLNISDPASTEDGFRVRRGFLDKLAPLAIGEASVSYGASTYPLYVYGTKERPRCFPNQGERLRKDGVVYAVREYDDDWDWLLTHESMLDKPDRVFDAVFCGEPGAEVISVDVMTTEMDSKRLRTNPSVSEPLRIYHNRAMSYSKRLIKCYKRIMEDSSANISLPLMRKFAEAYNVAPNDPELISLLPSNQLARLKEMANRKQLRKFVRTRKNEVLGEWWVKIRYAYRYHVGKGAKLSDNHGAKGVFCQITDDEDMFRDEFGNVADITVFGGAVTSRMNVDQLLEEFMNAFARDVGKDCEKLIGDERWDEAWEHITNCYRILSPEITYKSIMKIAGDDPERQRRHLMAVTGEGKHPRYTVRADDDRTPALIFDGIEGYRPPDEGHITFTNYLGVKETTLDVGLIAPKAMCILEKTAHNSMAANTARAQHHGFPSSTATKGSTPGNIKEQAPKVFSETETRMKSNAVGAGLMVARLAHMSNNPSASKASARTLFESPTPFDHDSLVDYNEIPLGSHSAKNLIESTLAGLGAEFVGITPQELHDSGLNIAPIRN